MGPILLCDKSTIQTLDQAAPTLLHHYFSLNIPPILFREVLGDLAKRELDERAASSVMALARRLASTSIIPNIDFRDIIVAEVNGNEVPMDRRPVVASATELTVATGETVVKIDEDLFEKALLRWRNGDFQVSDLVASNLWRRNKEVLDWRASLERLRGTYSHNLKRKKTLADTLEFVDDLMASGQDTLLPWFCEQFGIEASFVARLNCVLPITQLPYTQFCIRVSQFANLFVSTEPFQPFLEARQVGREIFIAYEFLIIG